MTRDSLRSKDPRERFRAVRALRDDHSEEAGRALVEALCGEQPESVWWLIAVTTLPIWLPLLDRHIATLGTWPFDARRTNRVIDLCVGNSLVSADAMVESWARSDDSRLRLAASKYRIRRSADFSEARAELTRLKQDVGRAYTGSDDAETQREFFDLVSGILSLELWAEEHWVTEDAEEPA